MTSRSGQFSQLSFIYNQATYCSALLPFPINQLAKGIVSWPPSQYLVRKLLVGGFHVGGGGGGVDASPLQ